MEGWSEDDVETFERLMTRFADGVTSLTDVRADARLGRQGLGRGRPATAPRSGTAPY